MLFKNWNEWIDERHKLCNIENHTNCDSLLFHGKFILLPWHFPIKIGRWIYLNVSCSLKLIWKQLWTKMIATCFKICTFILVINGIVRISGHDGTLDSKSREHLSSENSSSDKPVDFKNINLTEIMTSCNESFRVQMGISKRKLIAKNRWKFYFKNIPDYLKELNETGSFPEESTTDKTPMVLNIHFNFNILTVIDS